MERKQRTPSLGAAEDFFSASIRYLNSRLGSAFHISNKSLNKDEDSSSTKCKCSGNTKRKSLFRLRSKSKSVEKGEIHQSNDQKPSKEKKRRFKRKRQKSTKDGVPETVDEPKEQVKAVETSEVQNDDVFLADGCSSYDDELYDDTDEWDDIDDDDETDYWWAPDDPDQKVPDQKDPDQMEEKPFIKSASEPPLNIKTDELQYPVVYEGEVEETRTEKIQKEEDYFPPPYMLKKSSASVTMTPRTWDIMLSNLRIALETDNFFTCDQFLGTDIGFKIHCELMELKNRGYFEKSSERQAGFGRSLFLEKPSSKHRHLDCLLSLVYNLVNRYKNDWKYFTVELCHCKANEQPQEIFEFDDKSDKSAMKIVYFPNRIQTLRKPGDIRKWPRISLTTSGGSFDVDLHFDRLVAFWGDTLEHEISTGYFDTFLVIIWLFR